jgi:hypothetical protein
MVKHAASIFRAEITVMTKMVAACSSEALAYNHKLHGATSHKTTI